MKKLLCSAVAVMALALAAAPAMAQAGPDDRDTVQIWGQLEETLADELARYGSRVEVVTAEQIQNGGFNDVSQTLQMAVPGLYVAPKNGAFDYVNASLLGGRRVDIIWLIDGVRISNRLYTTTTPLDTIPAHMIEKIEVLKGGQSLFYGTSAVSGAINIVTRGFSDEQKAQFGIGVDSQEGRHIDGYTSGAVGEHHFVVYASHDEAEGIKAYRDQDVQPSAFDRDRGYDVTTFGAKYGYNFSDALKVSANYQHTDATLDFAMPSDAITVFNKRDEDIVSAKLDWSPNDKFDFFAKAYYHWWDTRYTDIRNDRVLGPGNPVLISDREFWGFEDYGINLLGQYKVTDAVTVLGGVDYQNYNGEDQVFLIAPLTEDVVAPFAQVRWDLNVLNGLRLAAGVRHNMPSGEGDATVWNVSGDLDINDYFYARGQVGTSFRLPDSYELFVADPCCEQGNPDLKGEESFNVEGAIGGRAMRASWELTLFHRELDDLIQLITVPETRPVGQRVGNYSCSLSAAGCFDTFDNEGSQIETNGVEITVNYQFTNDLTGTFDWTHTEAEPEGGGSQLFNIPKDTAKVILDWDPAGRRFGGGVSAAYVGDTTTSSSGGFTADIGDYVLVDLNARWYLDNDRKHRIGFRVENLFDEEYFSSLARGRIDGTGSPGTSYPAGNLGTERTFHISYTFTY